MLKSLPILKPEWYTPQAEQGSQNPTRFLLRPLNGVELCDVSLVRKGNGFAFDEAGARALLKYGLVGWDKFSDPDGALHRFSADQERNLEHLSLELVAELSLEIWLRSRLSEEQRKNLSSQRTSQQSEGSPSTASAADGEGIATSEAPPR